MSIEPSPEGAAPPPHTPVVRVREGADQAVLAQLANMD
jgi:hypothetical protein